MSISGTLPLYKSGKHTVELYEVMHVCMLPAALIVRRNATYAKRVVYFLDRCLLAAYMSFCFAFLKQSSLRRDVLHLGRYVCLKRGEVNSNGLAQRCFINRCGGGS